LLQRQDHRSRFCRADRQPEHAEGAAVHHKDN